MITLPRVPPIFSMVLSHWVSLLSQPSSSLFTHGQLVWLSFLYSTFAQLGKLPLTLLLARSFNLCYRYIDDLIVFNNKKFLDYLKEIYPSQLTVEKANKSDHLADYLDLTFIIDSGGKLSTRLYDKRDDFDFHIVNFPFLSSNIPSGPSYGVYISQLIRYARCCSHYDDFRYRHKCLVDRLLSQGYKALRLEKSFKKFYGRYQDLIEKYRRSVNAMVSDSFPGQFLFNM